jgi:hypothetical protein
VNPKKPPAAGVPERAPPLVSVSPGGRLPEASDHAYGGDPPAALRASEYEAPTLLGGSVEDVRMEGADVPAETKRIRLFPSSAM